MIVIDIAHPATDLEETHNFVKLITTEEEREAAYELFNYVFGQSTQIDDEHLEVLMNSELADSPGSGEPETVEELRNELEKQKEANSGGGFVGELSDAFIRVVNYLFLGNNRKEAEKAQREAISNDYDMSVSVSAERITD